MGVGQPTIGNILKENQLRYQLPIAPQWEIGLHILLLSLFWDLVMHELTWCSLMLS